MTLGSRIWPGSTGLRDQIASMQIEKVSQTTTILHVYADGTSGNDANDGLTSSTPKKTLQAVVDLVPDVVKHPTVVHLNGTFSNSSRVYVEKNVVKGMPLLIDGGTSTTVVADNAGSPWVADTYADGYIGLSSLAWATNQYGGYWVEILTGPAAGQTRLIQENTSTTITPARKFSTSPGAAQFRIVRPTTQLAGTGFFTALVLRNLGDGAVGIQNLYFSGTMTLDIENSPGNVGATHTIINNSHPLSQVNVYQGAGIVYFSADRYNPNTFALENAVTNTQAGLSILQAPLGSLGLYCRAARLVILYQCYVPLWFCNSVARYIVNQGTRIYTLILFTSFNQVFGSSASSLFTSSVGYATTKLGGSPGPGPGIFCSNSSLGIGTVDISNCIGHAIELCNCSHLNVSGGTLTGTGNLGAGVYAHDVANITIHGAPNPTPTLTGALGNISTDGATQLTTWATLAGGTRVSDGYEMVVAKRFTPFFG